VGRIDILKVLAIIFDGFLAGFYKCIIALLIGFVFIVISLIRVKRKDNLEVKYQTFFWIGLLFILMGFWFLFH